MGSSWASAGATGLAGIGLVVSRAAAAGAIDLPAPREGAADARRRAVEILARPELRPEPRSLVQRILDKAGELLGTLLDGVGGGSPVLAWALVGLFGALLTVVVWRSIRALQADGTIGGDVAVDGRRRPAADWRAEAAAHEAGRRYREALRCSWRALVADLAGLGLVEEVPGRTTGEYRVRVDRALPLGAEPFGRATRLFEDAWYAAVEVGQGEVAQVRALGDQVLAEARRR